MSAERHHEHAERHEQHSAELETARREKLEELRNSEVDPDKGQERAEAARALINKQEKAPEPATTEEAAPKPNPQLLLNPKLNYAQTLASLQRTLKPVSRSFSKIIHAPIVEKTSEVLERTIARPSVALGATWTALIVGGTFYFTARHFGYTLSGSELLFSFIVGAGIGLILEALVTGFKRR